MHSDKKPYSCNYVTNVTFNADRLGISNHTCEPTLKKNLTRAINVTISASDLSNSNYTCESTVKKNITKTGSKMLARPTHPPGGIHARLAGGRAALGQRAPPTHQAGNTPPRGVARPPGGQRPITPQS